MATPHPTQVAGNDEGFTLIELLVVVIIMGILASIAVPIFLGQRRQAYDSQLTADLRNAAIRMETYATNNNGAFDGAAMAGFRSTPGATMTTTVAADRLSYCLQADHDQVPHRVYNSLLGGLQAVGAAC